jgi:hypothetical protein
MSFLCEGDFREAQACTGRFGGAGVRAIHRTPHLSNPHPPSGGCFLWDDAEQTPQVWTKKFCGQRRRLLNHIIFRYCFGCLDVMMFVEKACHFSACCAPSARCSPQERVRSLGRQDTGWGHVRSPRLYRVYRPETPDQGRKKNAGLPGAPFFFFSNPYIPPLVGCNFVSAVKVSFRYFFVFSTYNMFEDGRASVMSLLAPRTRTSPPQIPGGRHV